MLALLFCFLFFFSLRLQASWTPKTCQHRYAYLKIKNTHCKKKFGVGYDSLETYSVQIIPMCTKIASISSFTRYYFFAFFEVFCEDSGGSSDVVCTNLAFDLDSIKTLILVHNRKCDADS